MVVDSLDNAGQSDAAQFIAATVTITHYPRSPISSGSLKSREPRVRRRGQTVLVRAHQFNSSFPNEERTQRYFKHNKLIQAQQQSSRPCRRGSTVLGTRMLKNMSCANANLRSAAEWLDR